MAIWAVISAVVVLVLCLLVRTDLTQLDQVDGGVGREVYTWSVSQHWLLHFLLFVQTAFGTIAMTAYTVVAAAMLALRKHRRAAIWTVVVMSGASLTTTVLKQTFGRTRPVWEDPVQTLSSFSFPSGHSSGIASAAGVAILLASLLVRRRSQRRAIIGLALALVVLVGSDRLLLGVHNLSDVVAGYGVGVFWVLAAALVFDPAPRARPKETFAGPLPRTRKLAVILNPIKVEDVDAFKALVERMAAESGWTAPTWHLTTVADPGRSMAEQAAIDGAELVLVCGGDGTVRTVCAELAGTGIPVGVVPAGTGNLLARNLDIPLYLNAAIDVGLNGQDRAIDLVAISGDGIGPDEHFLVMAGMGFDAAIMEGANEQIKAKVGWLAYIVSGLRNIMFQPVRVEISLDGGPWTKHRARTVVVGNVGYLQAGMPLLPDAAIDDGILDVVILHPRRFLSWIPLAVRILSKGKRTDDTVNRMTGRKVSVRAATDTPRQLDGDPIGAGRELNAEVRHGRLLVRVPH
ncbi:YegS/Rv2252/BmrU family lipid kinase [Nocardioides mesophilus]|uniref:YegS/Rv2252/BmrU family lipid kinase n=1 Tax=Nocardioides mesophilus TaxID=433659 RepID=A0A7G9RG01_9ACTN|nr:YegS/Rv2252/BmrU family lipid kinase [Nocardioides mesophilus]QNN54526.1 YegS/Rv2252/BmrU family lipid kinase [Nocardioides mesophilus]